VNNQLVFGDIVVIIIIIFLPVIYFFTKYTETNYTSQVIISSNEKDELFSLVNDTEVVRNNVKVSIKSGKVSVIESSCQNKICIKTGVIKNPGQLIVCVPNKVVIKIVSNKKNFDTLGY